LFTPGGQLQFGYLKDTATFAKILNTALCFGL
jgi:hypothetical protein